MVGWIRPVVKKKNSQEHASPDEGEALDGQLPPRGFCRCCFQDVVGHFRFFQKKYHGRPLGGGGRFTRRQGRTSVTPAEDGNGSYELCLWSVGLLFLVEVHYSFTPTAFNRA